MTLKEIEARIFHIHEIRGDDEMAHSEEDKLRDDFITYIASLSCLSDELAYLPEKARLVLTTSEIEFSRWCA